MTLWDKITVFQDVPYPNPTPSPLGQAAVSKLYKTNLIGYIISAYDQGAIIHNSHRLKSLE